MVTGVKPSVPLKASLKHCERFRGANIPIPGEVGGDRNRKLERNIIEGVGVGAGAPT